MSIRTEEEQDWAAVRAVHESAFGRSAEARLVTILRGHARPVISLLAEDGDVIVGHMILSPVALSGHPERQIMGLAPLAVAPERQRTGIGSALVRAGFERCKHLGYEAVVVLGHPAYYRRLGFTPAARFGIRCEYDVPEETFMVVELRSGCLSGATGKVIYHTAFNTVSRSAPPRRAVEPIHETSQKDGTSDMAKLIEFETTRLRLRQWCAADREPFAALNADPRVMEFFPASLSRAESDAMADQCQVLLAVRGWGFWVLETRQERKFIGFVGLNATAPELPFSPSIEISWRLAAQHWNKGYATEAGRGVLRVGFVRLYCDAIVAFTAVGNSRSRAVMERIGLRNTETLFEHPKVPVGSVLRTHCLYRVTREQWEANNSS